MSSVADGLVSTGGFAVPFRYLYRHRVPLLDRPEFTPEQRARWKLEGARSDDPNDPEGFYRTARFDEPCQCAACLGY